MSVSLLHKLKRLSSTKILPIRRLLERLTNAPWYDWPFGRIPNGTEEEYMCLAAQIKDQKYPEIEEYEKNKKYTVNQQWLENLALHTQIH
jgi:hypothetical protein